MTWTDSQILAEIKDKQKIKHIGTVGYDFEPTQLNLDTVEVEPSPYDSCPSRSKASKVESSVIQDPSRLDSGSR